MHLSSLIEETIDDDGASFALTLINGTRHTMLGKVLYNIYTALFTWPLQNVYLRGLWANRPMEDICAQLTNHRADFWALHSEECATIVAKNFDSWLVYAQFSVYLIVWLWVLRRLCCGRCTSS